MIQEYTSNKEFTEEMRQADADHGIFEVDNRTLILNPQQHKFSFVFDYYYEHEGAFYNMVKQVSNQTKLSGTYHQEGNKFVATITEGSQDAENKLNGQKLYFGNNLTGSFEFIQEEGSLIIQKVDLQPQEIDRRGSIMYENQSYKAK